MVVPDGKMDGTAPFGVRAGIGTRAGFGAAVYERATEFGTVLGKFHTVMTHFKTGRADGHTVRANSEIIFIFELYAPLFVEGNERNDALPAAVFVNRHSVMCGVKEQLGDFVVRQKSLHGEEAVEKSVGVVAGSRLKQRKYRQIAYRVGGCEHIEVIPVIKTASAGVPADITVGLGVIPVTVTGKNAALFALAQPFFPLL